MVHFFEGTEQQQFTISLKDDRVRCRTLESSVTSKFEVLNLYFFCTIYDFSFKNEENVLR